VIRALFLRPLRQHATLLLVLFLSLALMEFLLVWVAVVMGIGPEFKEFLEGFLPPEITEMIFGQFGLTTFQGAVAFGYQHPLSMVASVAMVMVAGTLPAAERERGYLELFLSRPVPRSRYLLANLLFLVLVSLVLPLGLLVGTVLGLGFVDSPQELPWYAYLPAAEGMALLLLAVGSYTLLLATGARRRGLATAQAVAFTLLFYWMDFMGDYWDTLVYARKLSPFFYFEPSRASLGGGLSGTQVAVFLGIALGTSLLAVLNFQRQDL
jgi:ABC-type transport system involved in multi-copper enzyme maturation permease subunit